jgi:molecular chaperone GrpE (heat shock protein)
MSTEPTVETGEETLNPTPEVTETPEVVTPEVEAKAEETPPEEDETSKAIKRLQRRIDKRTSDVYRTRAENEQLKAELERLKAGQTEEAPKVESDVYKAADQIAEAKIFAKTASEIVETGRKTDPKFMDTLRDLASEVGEFVQPNGLPSPFMKAVLDISENPTKLLRHLGKNLEIAAELTDLPVTKLAARLDRIEREMSQPATSKLSSAPKPLEPVKPSGKVDGYHPDMSDAEFAKWREGQLKARGR